MQTKEERCAYKKEWYARNRERQLLRHKRYYLENKDALIEAQRGYKDASPQSKRESATRYQEKKRALIREAKNVPCADCEGRFPYWVMDLDHVRGEKELNIGRRGMTQSDETLLLELAKCEAVCANCHRERTHDRVKGG